MRASAPVAAFGPSIAAAESSGFGICPSRGAGRGPRRRHGRRLHGRRRRRLRRVLEPGRLRLRLLLQPGRRHQHPRSPIRRLVALGTPPLGLSYYRTAIAAEKNGRNTLVAHHAGVSLVQSLGGRLAVGTTLKLVHGIGDPRRTAARHFHEQVRRRPRRHDHRIAGPTGPVDPEPAGAGVRDAGGAIRLDRRVRAGVSIHARQNTTVAADLDLTTATTPRGDWRDAAIGVEAHPVRKAWLRGGVHWNTAGDRPRGGADRQRRGELRGLRLDDGGCPGQLRVGRTATGAGASGCGSSSRARSTLANFI